MFNIAQSEKFSTSVCWCRWEAIWRPKVGTWGWRNMSGGHALGEWKWMLRNLMLCYVGFRAILTYWVGLDFWVTILTPPQSLMLSTRLAFPWWSLCYVTSVKCKIKKCNVGWCSRNLQAHWPNVCIFCGCIFTWWHKSVYRWTSTSSVQLSTYLTCPTAQTMQKHKIHPTEYNLQLQPRLASNPVCITLAPSTTCLIT